jgi:phosphoribosylanthranilate isomerase
MQAHLVEPLENEMPTAIKICCISSMEEVKTAVDRGATALGFVSRMPSGPGPIEESLIAELVPHVSHGISTFLLTCETRAKAIIEQQHRTGVNTIQLVDEVEPGTHRTLHETLDGVSIVQVIHVTDRESVEQAVRLSTDVDALLLDSGNPKLAVKELGGTGRVHDWALSSEIRERVSVPVYLAGGLNASNVREAIDTVDPFGVDVCSGVRTNGHLDPAKLSAFVSAARSVTPR